MKVSFQDKKLHIADIIVWQTASNFRLSVLNLLIDLLLREIRTTRFGCEDEDIPPPPVCNHSITCNTETFDVVHVCDILSNYPMSDASAHPYV